MENGKSSIFLLVPFTFIKNFYTNLPFISIFKLLLHESKKKCRTELDQLLYLPIWF